MEDKDTKVLVRHDELGNTARSGGTLDELGPPPPYQECYNPQPPSVGPGSVDSTQPLYSVGNSTPLGLLQSTRHVPDVREPVEYPQYPLAPAPAPGYPYRATSPQPIVTGQPTVTSNTVVMNQGLPQTVLVQNIQPQRYSLVGHFVYACVVFWCCGWLLGAIAFFVALYADSRNYSNDHEGAKRAGIVSLVFSTLGLLTGIACIIALAVIYSQTGYYK